MDAKWHFLSRFSRLLKIFIFRNDHKAINRIRWARNYSGKLSPTDAITPNCSKTHDNLTCSCPRYQLPSWPSQRRRDGRRAVATVAGLPRRSRSSRPSQSSRSSRPARPPGRSRNGLCVVMVAALPRARRRNPRPEPGGVVGKLTTPVKKRNFSGIGDFEKNSGSVANHQQVEIGEKYSRIAIL